ncbi:MAG: Uma2 family endonuclease [Firmicutes bacterium]|nr:Uma2 family endonuclease [Bacillota bacterium]
MVRHKQSRILSLPPHTSLLLQAGFSLKYLDYAIANHEVVITKNGKKAVRFSPYITDFERYLTIKEEALDYQYGGKKVPYDEFMEIYEKSNLRMEFINGEIFLLFSPGTFHHEISSRLCIKLAEYLKGKKCKVFYTSV